MKNKKILKTLATLTMGVATAVGLCFGTTACGHKHSYSEDWTSNDTQHWHDANCKHTDEKSELGDHVGIEDGVCDICLYEVPVASVDVTASATSVKVGGKVTVSTAVLPTNAADKTITYTSSNTSIATVNSAGEVVGVEAGSVTITATSVNGKTDTVTITVTAASSSVAVTGVTLDKSELSLTVGGATGTLTATVAPEGATNKNVTWKTSDATIATVSDGTVTAVAAGTATITVTTVDGSFEATCAVTVSTGSSSVAVTGVTLNKGELTLEAGGSETLTATIAPENADNKNVSWTSSDEEVATVVNGKVSAVGAGTATITVTTEDGDFKATCAVTVSAVDQLSEADFKAAIESSLAAKSMTVEGDSEQSGEIIMKLDAVNYIVYSQSSKYGYEGYSTFDGQDHNEISYYTYRGKWVRDTYPTDSEDADEWINDYKMEGLGEMLQIFTQVEYSSLTFDANTGKYTLSIPEAGMSISITIVDGKVSGAYMGKDVYTISDYNNTELTLPENAIDYVNLSSSASYKNKIGVGRETTIDIEVTKSEDGSAYEGPIYFESSDETIATVDANGKITGVKAGQCEITVWTDFGDITHFNIDVSADVSIYDDLAYTQETIWANNFNDGKVEIYPFDDWGVPGVYAEKTAEGKTNTLTVENGELVQTITGGTNYGAYIDFGPVKEYVEGYFELKVSATGTKWNVIQFKDGSNKTVFVIGTGVASGDTKLYYAVGDKVQDGTNLLAAAKATDVALKATTAEATNVYKIYYKFDLVTGKVNLEINDKKFEAESEISSLAGIYIPASSSGSRLITLDNIAICGKQPTVEEYKATALAKLEAQYIKLVGKEAEDENPAIEGTHELNKQSIDIIYNSALETLNQMEDIGGCLHILSWAFEQFNYIDSDAVVVQARQDYIDQLAVDYPSANYTINADDYAMTVGSISEQINGMTSRLKIGNYYEDVVPNIMSDVWTDAMVAQSEYEGALQYANEWLDNYEPVIEVEDEELKAQIESDIADIIAQAKQDINAESVTTAAQVNAIFNKAQEDIELALASGDIDAYRQANIGNLQEYAQGIIATLDETDDSELINAINAAVTTGTSNINAADNNGDVDTAYDNAVAAIDALVEADTLAKEIVSAKANLNNHYNTETATSNLPVIPTDKQTALEEALEEGLAAIEAAEDVDEVATAYNGAVDEINGIIDEIKALKFEITVKGLEEDIVIEVVYGDTLSADAITAKEPDNKLFDGLYTDQAHEEEYEYEPIYEDDTLYAQFVDAKVNTVTNSFNWAAISNTIADQAVLTDDDLTGANSFLKVGTTGVKYRKTIDNTKTGVTTQTGGTGGIVQTNGEGLIVSYNGTGSLTISIRADGDSKVSGFAVKGPDKSYIAAKTATNSSFKAVGGNVYTITGSVYSSIEFEIKASGNYTICFIADSGRDGTQLRIAGVTQVDKTKEEVTAVSSVSISAADEATELEAYKTLQLTATVAPENAYYKTVTWSSSDNTTATVDENGLVTAIKEGTVTITATAVNGVNGTYNLTITESDETRYALKFMLNDGTESVYSSDMLLKDAAIEKPATDPTREGYIFTGWYTTAAAETKYDFTDAAMGEAAVTIYAGWEEDAGNDLWNVSDLKTESSGSATKYESGKKMFTIQATSKDDAPDGATNKNAQVVSITDSLTADEITFSQGLAATGNGGAFTITNTHTETIEITVYYMLSDGNYAASNKNVSGTNGITWVVDGGTPVQSDNYGETSNNHTAYSETIQIAAGKSCIIFNGSVEGGTQRRLIILGINAVEA